MIISDGGEADRRPRGEADRGSWRPWPLTRAEWAEAEAEAAETEGGWPAWYARHDHGPRPTGPTTPAQAPRGRP